MSYTSQIKNEIAALPLNEIENRNLLLGYLFVNGNISNNKVYITLENMAVARKLFKTLKYSYKLDIKMTVRSQKKFKLKTIYIFEVYDKDNIINDELQNIDLSDEEAMTSFIKGIFLASGSISDPKKSGYHMELLFSDESDAIYVQNILKSLAYNFKKIKRDKSYMLYLKASEEISDFIKLLGCVNALFYYEDIRIYRDHKNMVNRLNNCEQANLEKSLKTSDKQLKIITYLRDNDYLSLLDDKTRQVAEYRLKYPEESFQVLSDIISSETDKRVSKSYINHHFRKINEVYDKIIKTQEKWALEISAIFCYTLPIE